MNPFNKIFLALVLFPRQFYAAWGVNVKHLTAILTTKLIMDDRRPNTIQATKQQRSGNKEISKATLGTMIISLLMGLTYLFAFAVGNDYITQLTIYFSIFVTMLCMSLVSDFTSVLIDVRDNNIILPKPVNDRTFVLARLLHIFIHICKMVLPMSLPGMIYLSVNAHIGAGFILLFVVMFATLLSIFLINAVYIIILRITTPEKFKNIISYIQIAFAILIYASYQIVPRLMDDAGVESFDVSQYSWMIIAPPYWFACAFNVLLTLQSDAVQFAAAAMAVAVPLLSIYAVVKFLAPAFNQKLAMISGGESAAPVADSQPAVQQKKSYVEKIAALLTGSKAEQTGFLFTWKMMARSRDFKVRVYPSIGYFVVILFVIFFRNRNAGDSDAANLAFGFKPIVAIYLSSIVLIAAVSQIAYSDKSRAAWMFLVTPLQRPGPVMCGALKAAIFQFYFFMALISLALGLWMAGPAILPNVVLGLSNQLLITYLIAGIGFDKLPFSQPIGDQKSGQFFRRLLLLFASGAIGVVHFFIFRNTAIILVALLISAACVWLMMRNIRQRSWWEIQMPA